MTLTDFLLDRIAEDEATAADTHTIECGYGMGENTSIPCTCNRPARALAECKAKREIINESIEDAEWMDGEAGCCHTKEQIRGGLCPRFGPAPPTVHILAAIYADHPDYQAEWA